jgi:hypothetical protein
MPSSFSVASSMAFRPLILLDHCSFRHRRLRPNFVLIAPLSSSPSSAWTTSRRQLPLAFAFTFAPLDSPAGTAWLLFSRSAKEVLNLETATTFGLLNLQLIWVACQLSGCRQRAKCILCMSSWPSMQAQEPTLHRLTKLSWQSKANIAWALKTDSPPLSFLVAPNESWSSMKLSTAIEDLTNE